MEKKGKCLPYPVMSSFFYELSLLFGSGISAEESVRLLLDDMKENDKNNKAVAPLSFIEEKLSVGITLSEAMSASKVFPEYAYDMIKTGEITGNLDKVAYEIGRWCAVQQKIKDDIKGAITYPSILFAMMCAIMFIISISVLPVFEDVLNRMGAQISGFSAVALDMGKWIGANVLVIIAIIAVVALLIFVLRRKIAEKIPAQIKNARARFADAMAMGMACGLDSTESCDIACRLVGNKEITVKANKCKTLLGDGKSLYEAVSESEVLPMSQCRLLAVGMRAGAGDTVMREIADKLSAEAEKGIDRVISVIEPVIVIFMCVSAGFMLLSVMMPLLSALSVLV